MKSYMLGKQDSIIKKLKMINKKLDLVLAGQVNEANREVIMSAELDDLATKVAANTSVSQSAVTLLNGLGAQIAAMANDPVAIRALASQLQSDDAGLAAAVTANTPATPTP